MWDKDTGAINRTVARHWIDNWDLVERMRRDWSSGLGEKLRGKLHIFAGADDTFFLDNAVMDAQDFLEATTSPYYDGEVVVGEHDGRGFAHCFNGYSYDPSDNATKLPNAITREMYLQVRQRPPVALLQNGPHDSLAHSLTHSLAHSLTHYVQKFVPVAAARFFETAPADVARDDPVLMGWRY